MPTVLIVPGLRDHVEAHWQTRLAARLDRVHTVPPMGRDDLDCGRRVAAVEQAATAIDGPILVVAHSGGVITLAHWARTTGRPVLGALLAAPPDFETAMPEGYPTLDGLRRGGWLPVPHGPLPFPSIVVASRNDPLGRFDRVADLTRGWGSRVVDLGDVGHLNPASGFGDWPAAGTFIRELAASGQQED